MSQACPFQKERSSLSQSLHSRFCTEQPWQQSPHRKYPEVVLFFPQPVLDTVDLQGSFEWCSVVQPTVPLPRHGVQLLQEEAVLHIQHSPASFSQFTCNTSPSNEIQGYRKTLRKLETLKMLHIASLTKSMQGSMVLSGYSLTEQTANYACHKGQNFDCSEHQLAFTRRSRVPFYTLQRWQGFQILVDLSSPEKRRD